MRKVRLHSGIPSTITSKGQVTIPVAVRSHLGLSKHDKIVFVLEADRTARVVAPKFKRVRDLGGVAGSIGVPMQWSEMKAIALEDRFPRKDA